jgi:hypothetical protein
MSTDCFLSVGNLVSDEVKHALFLFENVVRRRIF